ncbi:MAG TPA: DUF4438 domain-containing protein [Firmicutes bacterium]|nr:DUF4438 domain-containing protein [Candidatus Fermentithermobacillaceae bacterium]
MLRTNEDKLVMLSVQGEISSPASAPRICFDGVVRVTPGTGGITYNVKVGDCAFGLAGDHVEPGVSTKHKDEKANSGYNTLSCVGNTAYVISGDAKGAKGVVTGKHGGIEHVIIHFDQDTLEKLQIGDKINVRAFGQGLELSDYPSVKCMNLDPGFLHKMGIVEKDGVLEVPVAHIVPPEFMGSGLGASSAERGDYDITSMERERLAELGLDKIRLGDIVAIQDSSSFYGRSYRRGAVIIGIVVHGDSNVSGHGPGVTSLLTALDGKIRPVKVDKANIADYLGLS